MRTVVLPLGLLATAQGTMGTARGIGGEWLQLLPFGLSVISTHSYHLLGLARH